MSELKPCPFCGSDGIVLHDAKGSKFQIVGCSVKSMLCPNPSISVYPNKDGDFDYSPWNSRVKHLEQEQVKL